MNAKAYSKRKTAWAVTPDTTSPVFASPIKVSAVPKPLIQPSKTGKQAVGGYQADSGRPFG
ncbi:hypothetical protein AGABI1DRAFT_133919 [Agaricus bisporus var. burnettii JB137-S8]|uniref:Uncharacterized protein n=1 Tax=Agaricus bisporus var. burnettii (strain JB137-S8 / ATCC MYA-4627 / FGSC 10392) TaxID=597362 RepID=K5WT06_AGABU|nr:uncharacterized protein AGABI1DRAFT_133919 [Agaricus bisporus var. burnettii JB137-S8]XP_007336037.1 uncharacterized protein AGABI1DRAFT_135048 [Agaricus bisporus var. burnettii JB137-S8]EKM73324.1 hypothetical protein AGABI1DRAFT_135048 [Agaricus bisporus var. burnettii JB137-S8]EKM73888.1 hypothetical protein AGABI1DRAFT_133919 [Agaricus bisporus var. burnettii JB137-S8]